jgi:asparagine synthase (glutamine-hydrolysing)
LALREALYGPRLGAPRPAAELAAEVEASLPDCDDTGGRFMLLDQRHWLPGDVLAKADRASMLVSLEVRTPYLDYELAEFAATVAPALHTGGRGKVLLRRLLSELLPESALRRPKTAFRVPVADWLRGPLAATMRDQVERGSACEEGWLERGALSRLLDEHARGERDRSEALWPALAFGLWLDRVRGRDAEA